jgi:hypothetical protein
VMMILLLIGVGALYAGLNRKLRRA